MQLSYTSLIMIVSQQIEMKRIVYLTCFSDWLEIQVNFLDDEYTFNEGDGVATVILTKTGSNEIPVMVSVVTMTQDDTATGMQVTTLSHAYTYSHALSILPPSLTPPPPFSWS